MTMHAVVTALSTSGQLAFIRRAPTVLSTLVIGAGRYPLPAQTTRYRGYDQKDRDRSQVRFSGWRGIKISSRIKDWLRQRGKPNVAKWQSNWHWR
jgi:hypothetical protein